MVRVQEQQVFLHIGTNNRLHHHHNKSSPHSSGWEENEIICDYKECGNTGVREESPLRAREPYEGARRKNGGG